MSFFGKKQKKQEPVVIIPVDAHRRGEQLTMFLILAALLKQNDNHKFDIIHREYEYNPYYPILGTAEHYQVKFPNGKTLFEITKNTFDKEYDVKINTATQCLHYNTRKPFMYAQALWDLTTNRELSPDSMRLFDTFANDGLPMHYLAGLLVQSK